MAKTCGVGSAARIAYEGKFREAVQEEGRPPTPENGPQMRPTRQFRSETEITETESAVPYRKIILWAIVGLAIVAGVVLYFKYAHLLSPLMG